MNYRHIYHAGNFADVFKHCILVLLLQKLLEKNKPMCYIDTHAGLGYYDLYSEAGQKNQEYILGIAKILRMNNPPDLIAPYLIAIKKLNENNPEQLHFYPGSPYIVKTMLRPEDKMILMELHKEDVLTLKWIYDRDKQVAVHHYDGYQGIKAFLPPPIRRGLVLIDPSFEEKNEFAKILLAIKTALFKWPTGVYAIWYPIKDFAATNNFLRELKTICNNNILLRELNLHKTTVEDKLISCGMAIINPPWQLEQQLDAVVIWLQQALDTTNNIF